MISIRKVRWVQFCLSAITGGQGYRPKEHRYLDKNPNYINVRSEPLHATRYKSQVYTAILSK
jgi:hypothetical protein